MNAEADNDDDDDDNVSDPHSSDAGSGSTSVEELRLDLAIRKADDLLVASLRQHDRQRRRRRLQIAFLTLGGIAMVVLIAVALIALLDPRGTQRAAADRAAPTTQENRAAPSTMPAPGAASANREQAEGLAAEGWAFWQKQKLLEAEAMFEKATELDPTFANAWNGLGWSRLNAGKTIAAQEAFEACIERQADHPAALNGLGWIHFGRREYEEAEKVWLKSQPLASAAWTGLAKLYLLQGNFAEARKWTEKIVKEGFEPEFAKKLHDAATYEKLDNELRRQIEPPAPPATAEADRR